MTIERTTQGWQCSDIFDGRLVHRHYIGYTKREAQQLFKRWLSNLGNSLATNPDCNY